MTRRRFMLVIAAVISGLGGLWWNRRARLGAVAAKLVDTLEAPASAAIVGRAALAALPPGTDAERLILDIPRALNTDPKEITDMAEDDLRALLDAQIRSEHMALDTLSVEGWELSATEARLYALVTLS